MPTLALATPGGAHVPWWGGLFASRGGEGSHQRLEPEREGSGIGGGGRACSSDLQLLPPAVPRRGCGQCCKRSRGDRGGVCGRCVLMRGRLSPPHSTAEERGEGPWTRTWGWRTRGFGVSARARPPASEDAEVRCPRGPGHPQCVPSPAARKSDPTLGLAGLRQSAGRWSRESL